MPDAEHGTSARMRSNGWSMSSCHFAGAPASPITHFRFELEPLQVFADATRARRVAFERDEVQVGEFEQMAGLAARRRARVEHAHAVTHAEQLRSELRAGVLHGHDAVVEAGNPVDGHRRGELDGVFAGPARGECDGRCSTCR